jgi:hypothetical protein
MINYYFLNMISTKSFLFLENFIKNSLHGNMSKQEKFNLNKNIQYQKYQVKQKCYISDLF